MFKETKKKKRLYIRRQMEKNKLCSENNRNKQITVEEKVHYIDCVKKIEEKKDYLECKYGKRRLCSEEKDYNEEKMQKNRPS